MLSVHVSKSQKMERKFIYWRMSQNEIVRIALNNRWLEEQGVPDMNAPAAIAALMNAKPDRMDGGNEVKAVWVVLHHGAKVRV